MSIAFDNAVKLRDIVKVRNFGAIFDYSTLRMFDDFLGDVLQDPWNGRVGSDPQCVAPAIVAGGLGGQVRLVTGNDAAATMAANGVQLESALNWNQTETPISVEVRISLSAITDIMLFVGFTDQVAALEAPFELGSANALTSNATNAVGWLFDTAADTDNWWLVGVAADSDATKQNTAIAPVAATFESLRVEVSGTTATFYRNDVQVGTAMTAAIAASAALTPVVAATSRGAASRNVDVDYILVQATRT
jgi:hypothetical protein